MNRKKRKVQHIKLAKKSQIPLDKLDSRFNYEPLFYKERSREYSFLGNNIGGPLLLSSITGGSKHSKKINSAILTAAKELNLPMGLGSIRPLLDNPIDKSFINKNHEALVYGNVGIAQLNRFDEINRTIDSFNLQGLIIHINPLQEWCQPEGDSFIESPLELLTKYIDRIESKVIVKEVGQGFGPRSIKELLKLPISALDLAGFGGTNFSKLELLRRDTATRQHHSRISNLGNSNMEMIEVLNSLPFKEDLEVIVSGGIKDFLDGFYYTEKVNYNSIYGYAYPVLKAALKGPDKLIEFLSLDIEGYNLAKSMLTIK